MSPWEARQKRSECVVPEANRPHPVALDHQPGQCFAQSHSAIHERCPAMDAAIERSGNQGSCSAAAFYELWQTCGGSIRQVMARLRRALATAAAAPELRRYGSRGL